MEAEGKKPEEWSEACVEKTLEGPLDSKIKPINPKGNQPWIFIGKTDAKAEAPILWLLDAKSQLIGKAPDAGKDWRQEEKGVTEDEMVGRHHQLNGHEVGQTPRAGRGQESLVCCSPWGRKESDTTWQLNNQWENSAWLEEIKDIICRSKWRGPKELWLVIYKTNIHYLSKSDRKIMNVFQGCIYHTALAILYGAYPDMVK